MGCSSRQRHGRLLATAVAAATAAALAAACSGSGTGSTVAAQPVGNDNNAGGSPNGNTNANGNANGDANTNANANANTNANGNDNTVAFKPGGPGPWPLTNQTFTAAQGLQEGPVVGTTTDEAQNLWVATPSALYLLRPGESTFTRFSSRDGLHLADHPQIYNEDSCGGAQGVPGSADGLGITTIVGGAAGEVFVGYHGVMANAGDCTDPPDQRHSGKLDRVRLQPDGTLEVKRLDMVTTGMGMNYWHNRTVWRMVYDHVLHPHTLYVGTDHGVDMMRPDLYRDPAPGEWTGFSIQEWMSDHVHVEVCYNADPVCMSGGEGNARMGDWRGLAIAPDGDLWHAGRWGAGKIIWTASLHDWNFRSGQQEFAEAFANDGPPVFPVSQPGNVVSLSAVTVAADGTAWFASAFFYGGVPDVPAPGSGLGIAHYLGNGKFEYHSPSEAGMSEQDVQDLVGLPDGRLVLAGAHSGLVFWNPATGAHTAMHAGQGIPSDDVHQLELDTMVSPPALHVSTGAGAATIRAFPP